MRHRQGEGSQRVSQGAPSPRGRRPGAPLPGESQGVKHHREAKTTIRRRINEEDFTKIGELLVSCD